MSKNCKSTYKIEREARYKRYVQEYTDQYDEETLKNKVSTYQTKLELLGIDAEIEIIDGKAYITQVTTSNRELYILIPDFIFGFYFKRLSNIFVNYGASYTELKVEMTNPVVVKDTLDTRGTKIIHGLFEGTVVHKITLINFNPIFMDTRSLFKNCVALREIDLGNQFDLTYCESVEMMFMNCYNLDELKLPDNFNTYNIEDFRRMFMGCNNLKRINFGNSFNTRNAKSVAEMFRMCKSLKELNLVNKVITNKLTKYYGMFDECEQLEKLELDKDFVLGNRSVQPNILCGTYSLKNVIVHKGMDEDTICNLKRLIDTNRTNFSIV